MAAFRMRGTPEAGNGGELGVERRPHRVARAMARHGSRISRRDGEPRTWPRSTLRLPATDLSVDPRAWTAAAPHLRRLHERGAGPRQAADPHADLLREPGAPDRPGLGLSGPPPGPARGGPSPRASRSPGTGSARWRQGSA